MRESAITSIEQQLFSEGYPEWNDLQALYHLEYLKRAKGTDAHIYARSKDEFKEKFAKYVEEQVEDNRESYLSRLLADIVKNRKKLPVFIIDNTDEFSLSYKVAVFQYFQSIRRTVDHCLLLFPATDRSAWTFSKTEIFNIYASKSFFLPTPSPREVFRKRVEYLKGKLQLGGVAQSTDYFTARGIRIKIGDLGAFAEVIENVFVDQDYAARRVGELSNYNMRKALGLSQRIITSSILKVDDLVRSFILGAMVVPSAERFMNALLKGDYQFFKPGDEPLLFSIYQVDGAIKQSPLIHLRLLALLHDLHNDASEDTDRYITVGSIFAFFGNMAIGEIAVQRALEALLAGGLIEPYDLSKKDYSDDQRVAIAQSGLSHLHMAVYNPVFFEQMALTTKIVDPEVAEQIRGAYKSMAGIDLRLESVREIFCDYLIAEDKRHCSIPRTLEYKAQVDLGTELLSQWKIAKSSVHEMLRLPESAASAVRATVERFDHSRGFGFVDVPSLRDTAFLHINVVEKSGFDEINDGDDLICDVERTEKGISVSRVLEISKAEGKLYASVVARVIPERGYGFVHVPETGIDAFFHFHLLSSKLRDNLYEGLELMVEIKTDIHGRSQVRKIG